MQSCPEANRGYLFLMRQIYLDSTIREQIVKTHRNLNLSLEFPETVLSVCKGSKYKRYFVRTCSYLLLMAERGTFKCLSPKNRCHKGAEFEFHHLT